MITISIKHHLSKFIVNRENLVLECNRVVDSEGDRVWHSMVYEPHSEESFPYFEGETETESLEALLDFHELEGDYLPDWYYTALNRLVEIANNEDNGELTREYALNTLMHQLPQLDEIRLNPYQLTDTASIAYNGDSCPLQHSGYWFSDSEWGNGYANCVNVSESGSLLWIETGVINQVGNATVGEVCSYYGLTPFQVNDAVAIHYYKDTTGMEVDTSKQYTSTDASWWIDEHGELVSETEMNEKLIKLVKDLK